MKYLKSLILLILLSALGSYFALPAQADDPHRAGLVVQLDNSTIITRCIEFSEDSISGYDVLVRSGLNVEASFDAMGAAICSINGVGCPIDNCWCDFPPNYWSYWHQSGNNWVYSQLGASNYRVHDGDIEGWRWGNGSPLTRTYSMNEICISATATPTASITPSSTGTVEPTNYSVQGENDTPFTLYIDSSSKSETTPSVTWTSVSAPSGVEISSPSATIDVQMFTPTVTQPIFTDTPLFTPTQKIKATSLRATRQAIKTQESLKKTMENTTSTPTIMPSPTEIPQPADSENNGIIKFLIMLIVLLVLASLGIWLMKNRG